MDVQISDVTFSHLSATRQEIRFKYSVAMRRLQAHLRGLDSFAMPLSPAISAGLLQLPLLLLYCTLMEQTPRNARQLLYPGAVLRGEEYEGATRPSHRSGSPLLPSK